MRSSCAVSSAAGHGRTGKLFAIEHENVVPDILTLSKPLANGLPISAMVTSVEIDKVCKDKGFLFFTTHANDPLVAAVGEKVLEIATRPSTMESANARGEQLLAGLHRLEQRYGCIGDVRGVGLMAGIEIVSDRESKEPAVHLAEELSKTMLQLGLWCQLQSQRVFRIGPPLISTEKQIQKGLDILESVFRTTPNTQPLYESQSQSTGWRPELVCRNLLDNMESNKQASGNNNDGWNAVVGTSRRVFSPAFRSESRHGTISTEEDTQAETSSR
ncbi:hypothetical protein LTR70_009310 [Exophiala xenobiotica]|uniref:Uncharacterized protein n=1 Tax=Lithohypha guttulata TaxID=1690604 RepID=A0ABR0JXW1_9EURO|nr:hypothetical protein LTR24_009147 [Lithohypha guttulata]KAK5310668.1 hypothetical protein LTR70_009310 [Exophiala xenobiotica]